MDVDEARYGLARAGRVLRTMGYLDLMGQVSLRLDDEVFAITPGYGQTVPPPGALRPSDILLVHRTGRVLAGEHSPPLDLPLHTEIYNQRPELGAVVVGSPPVATAFGVSGRQLAPLTHSQALLAHQGSAMIEPPGFISDSSRAGEVVARIGDLPVAQLRGLFTVFMAGSLTAALRLVDAYEHLATINLIAVQHNPDPAVVGLEHATEIDNSRGGGETIPSRDPARYFASLDRAPIRQGSSAHDSIDALHEKVALSCRILAAQKSLVAFFEHVSLRLPTGTGFLMSPAKNFSHMQARDVGTLSLDDECRWISGPYPPAPFRFYHRDLFWARPDVSGIVHTHEIFGRALMMAGVSLRPVFRAGAAMGRSVPVLSKPTMAFASEDRRAAVGQLGSDSVIHILSHGTDFLASSIEEATVMAVHRENQARTLHTASLLGQPVDLPPHVLSELADLGPSPREWWNCYATDALPSGRLNSREGTLDEASPGE